MGLTASDADIAHGPAVLLPPLETAVTRGAAVVTGRAAVTVPSLVSLIVHACEDQHVQQQQRAADGHRHTQRRRVRGKPVLLNNITSTLPLNITTRYITILYRA